jgi:hypothetical protein
MIIKIVLLLLVLSGCSQHNICSDILYIEKPYSAYWFIGDVLVTPGSLSVTAGYADVTKYIGQPPREFITGCPGQDYRIPEGFYTVRIAIPSNGDYFLRGEGWSYKEDGKWKNTILISPNKIEEKHLKELIQNP